MLRPFKGFPNFAAYIHRKGNYISEEDFLASYQDHIIRDLAEAVIKQLGGWHMGEFYLREIEHWYQYSVRDGIKGFREMSETIQFFNLNRALVIHTVLDYCKRENLSIAKFIKRIPQLEGSTISEEYIEGFINGELDESNDFDCIIAHIMSNFSLKCVSMHYLNNFR